MFSYTDEAVVTNGQNGRHLSTVVRRPSGLPDDQWRQHAEEVCKALNGLRATSSIAQGLQTVGRAPRPLHQLIAEIFPPLGERYRRPILAAATSEPQDFGPIKAHNLPKRSGEVMIHAETDYGIGTGYFLELKGSRGSVMRRVFEDAEKAEFNAAFQAFKDGALPIEDAQRLLFSDARDALIAALEEELAQAHEKLKARQPMPCADTVREENLVLRREVEGLKKQLADAKSELDADLLVELGDLQLRALYYSTVGSTMPLKSQRAIIKRVE